jgi:hypothetical protein
MTSVAALNFEAHKQLRVKTSHPSPASEGQHLIPVLVGEYVLAGADFPIVFVKNEDSGKMHSTAMTGIKLQQNLFFTKTDWLAKYVPVSVRPSPIALVPSREDENQLVICVIEDSPFLNNEEGEVLFNDDGEQSDYLKQQTELAREARGQVALTDAFIQKLLDLELLKSNPIKVQPQGEKPYELAGLHVIDEKALNELPDEEFQALRKSGFLPPIYAILSSMYRLDNLLTMYHQQHEAQS